MRRFIAVICWRCQVSHCLPSVNYCFGQVISDCSAVFVFMFTVPQFFPEVPYF